MKARRADLTPYLQAVTAQNVERDRFYYNKGTGLLNNRSILWCDKDVVLRAKIKFGKGLKKESGYSARSVHCSFIK